MDLDKNFWNELYMSGTTAWDAGQITTPIKDYVDQINEKDGHILIPGCGRGYEAEYLYQQGFRNVYVADISPLPLQDFKRRCPQFPEKQLLNIDFFEIGQKFDLILEQTFFCALDPSLRPAYAEKMAS